MHTKRYPSSQSRLWLRFAAAILLSAALILAAAPAACMASQGSLSSGAAKGEMTTLWIAGDSTSAAFNDENYYYPRYGWGTQLYRYFQGISIKNLSVPGTSTKNYPSTENYQTLLSGMKEGDFLLIGFGHNDEKPESTRYTDPNGSITTPGSTQYCLYENFIRPAKEAGVTPIVCMPVVRRDPGGNYNGASAHITSDQTTIEGTFAGGDYAKAIRAAAVGKGAAVLNLTARTKDLYERLGIQGTKMHHAFTSSNEASIDNTHTNIYGAAYDAYLIADELSKTDCPLKDYLTGTLTEPDISMLKPNPGYSYRAFNRPEADSVLWQNAGDWKATVFGDIGAVEYLNNIYFHFTPYDNGAIGIAAGRLGGSSSDIVGASVGKISSQTDGIAMYYQAVPSDRNFTFSATVTIRDLDPNNQASFGLMVRDDIYIDYVTSEPLGDYVAAAGLMMGSDDPWNCFARKNGVLTRGSNSTHTYKVGDAVRLQIQKTSDGYTCIFGDNPPVSAGFDFPLTAIDPEYVYVGMFAARSADVSFWDIKLEMQ